MTPLATVLVPTHTHADTLRYSVPTALRQSVRDIEVFIVGDGVGDDTRQIAAELVASDPRVRFFDFPKGENRGERHRHEVLAEARGEIVCYLFDDDLWLPNHVEVMQQMLSDADFAFAPCVVVEASGALRACTVDLSSWIERYLFTHPRSSTCSVPTAAAHTMALYRRLPWGWRPAPRGVAPDKYMWAQCLSVTGCRTRSASTATSLVFPDPPRRGWPTSARLEELAAWTRRLHEAASLAALEHDLRALQASPDFTRTTVFAWLYAGALHVPGAVAALRMARRLLQRRPDRA